MWYLISHTLLLAALAGAVVGLRRRDAATGALVMLLAYNTMVVLFLTKPHPRYTLPFLPLVFLLAAQGVVALARRGDCAPASDLTPQQRRR